MTYKTLEVEDLIAGEALKKLSNQPNSLTLTEWTNLSTVISQHLIQAIPYQSLSQESQGKQLKTIFKFRNSAFHYFYDRLLDHVKNAEFSF